MTFLFLLTFFILFGCGMDEEFTFTKDGYKLSDITQPTVLSVTPLPDEKGVALNTPIIASFSEPVDPDTVNELSFYLQSKKGRVNGTYIFSADLRTVTFVPSDAFEPLTTYSITINNRVKDLSQNELADQDPNDKLPSTPFVSQFTTGIE